MESMEENIKISRCSIEAAFNFVWMTAYTNHEFTSGIIPHLTYLQPFFSLLFSSFLIRTLFSILINTSNQVPLSYRTSILSAILVPALCTGMILQELLYNRTSCLCLVLLGTYRPRALRNYRLVPSACHWLPLYHRWIWVSYQDAIQESIYRR